VQPFRGLERGIGVRVSDSQIYAELKGDLVRYATALVGPDFAADVVSTVVVRVLSRGTLSDLDEPRPYLFRAVLNEARSSARGRPRDSDMIITDAALDEPNIHPEVIVAVLGLPAQQRAATYLVYWAGHTVTEASDLMGVGDGTVKRYLFLARNNLRGVLHART
jgi:DNA-directed RNA polymerase specialized sigma24 family protein